MNNIFRHNLRNYPSEWWTRSSVWNNPEDIPVGYPMRIAGKDNYFIATVSYDDNWNYGLSYYENFCTFGILPFFMI